MMNLRGILAAAAVLAVLAVGLWFSNKAENEKKDKPAADAPPKVVELPSDQIQQVAVVKGDTTTTIKRGGDTKWEIASPKASRADQDAANGVANTFNSLSADRLIEEKAADLKTDGLDKPAITGTVTKKHVKTIKLLLGDETPTSGGVFARLDGDPRVFILASFNKSSIDKAFKDLQDKRLLAFDSDKLTRVELTAKGQTLEFGKNNNNEWQILKPKPMRADGGNIEEIVRKLKDAKMDSTVSDEDAKKASAGWGAAQVIASAKVADASGSYQLDLRKTKDNTYLAKGSSMDGIYKVSSDLGDGLNKGLDDLRNKKLFDFGWNDLTKVEVHAGPKTVALAKEGDKWKQGAKEMDSTSVQALIDKLRDLAAIKFPDSGFTTAIFDASVSWGTKSEKVLVSKSGDKFFAKRDNEPAIYEIDKKAFEEMERAASDVKEPPPPKKDASKDAPKK